MAGIVLFKSGDDPQEASPDMLNAMRLQYWSRSLTQSIG